MERTHFITVEDRSKPVTGQSYRIVKTENKVKPWQILNQNGEDLTGKRYFTQQEAEAVIQEIEHYRTPRHDDHQPGTIDDMSEASLLAKESPMSQQYWQWKQQRLAAIEMPKQQPNVPEPEKQPSGTSITPVSPQQLADLEANLKGLQAAKAAETMEASGETPEDTSAALDVVEAEVELGALAERVARVEGLVENVSRLAEMYG